MIECGFDSCLWPINEFLDWIQGYQVVSYIVVCGFLIIIQSKVSVIRLLVFIIGWYLNYLYLPCQTNNKNWFPENESMSSQTPESKFISRNVSSRKHFPEKKYSAWNKRSSNICQTLWSFWLFKFWFVKQRLHFQKRNYTAVCTCVCVCVERERERESFLHLIELFVDLVDLFEISKELTNDGPIG